MPTSPPVGSRVPRDPLEQLPHHRPRRRIFHQDSLGCPDSSFLWRGVPQPPAPGDSPYRPPAAGRDVVTDVLDPLGQPLRFLLGHGAQDVGGQVGDFAALLDGVDGDANRPQLVAGRDLVLQLPAESIEAGHDHGHRASEPMQPSRFFEQGLIGRPIWATTRQMVLEVLTENPASGDCVAAAGVKLGGKRQALFGHLFLADADVDEGDGLGARHGQPFLIRLPEVYRLDVWIDHFEHSKLSNSDQTKYPNRRSGLDRT